MLKHHWKYEKMCQWATERRWRRVRQIGRRVRIKNASRWDGELANSDGRMSGWMSHMMSALLILLLLSAIMVHTGCRHCLWWVMRRLMLKILPAIFCMPLMTSPVLGTPLMTCAWNPFGNMWSIWLRLWWPRYAIDDLCMKSFWEYVICMTAIARDMRFLLPQERRRSRRSVSLSIWGNIVNWFSTTVRHPDVVIYLTHESVLITSDFRSAPPILIDYLFYCGTMQKIERVLIKLSSRTIQIQRSSI